MKRFFLVLRVFGILLLAVPCFAGSARTAATGPRWLSEAERQAVVFAAEYLADGPTAWWNHLSRRSPLRQLGRQAALAEIEVRAGSPAEAQWELQTAPADFSRQGAVFTLNFSTGIDDALELGLVQEGGAWKIDSVRMSAEPVGGKALLAPRLGESHPEQRLLPPPLAATPLWVLLAAGAAGALLLVGAWFERDRRLLSISLGLAGVLVAGSAAVVAALPRISARALGGPGGGASGQFEELRSLLPLRRALTRPEGRVPAVLPPEVRRQGVPGQVARLWWAQHLLGGTDLRGVDQMLAGFPSPGGFPLAELLRARLAFLRLEEVPTALAYQRTAAVGVAHEALLSEAAQAFLLLGFDEHAKGFLRQLRDLGSRQAATYLTSAEVAVTDDRFAEARDLFRTAWRLQPSPRAEVLRQPLLAALLDDNEIRKLVGLAAAEEPVGHCEEVSQRAIVPPAGFQARRLGRTLRLVRAQAELRVPGGCDLAPQATVNDHAEAWNRERAAKLLARLPALLAAARTAGALAQPSLRRETEDTAEALAERHRWADLLALTDGLSGELSSLPPNLVRLRARALRESGREAEARDLLIRLAKGSTAGRRTDPATLYQLADLFAREGNFDPAIRLVAKADSQLPYEVGGDRLRRLQMEKRLAASSKVYRSPHFEIRYPPGRGKKFVLQVAGILEAERQRLQPWIPVASSRVIAVHLLPFDEFRMGYSPDLSFIGLYDGTIRVPLGDVPRFVPFIVSILTHELAHAMIAESTDDRAPRWFHEGLAQHVEMVTDDVNPIPGYHDKGNLLGFPLIEPAIGSYSPALIAIGYDEARWTLHYIEQRHGKEGIRRLLAAFRAGQSTEEAVAAAFGSPISDFDRDLWRWAMSAPDLWKREVVRYDEDEE